MPTITVLSKPICVQCDGTYRAFDKKGLEKNVDYGVIDMTADESTMAFAMDRLQAQQAPVVVIHEGTWEDAMQSPELILEHWTGFRPDNIAMAAELINSYAA